MNQPPQFQPQPTSGATHGVSSIFDSLGSDIMAGIAYLLTIVPFVGFILQIVVFALEKNRFVKFHAAQAAILSAVGIVFGILLSILSPVFGFGVYATNSAAAALAGFGFALLFGCVGFILGLALLGLWIWAMISAFTGKATKLPLIGNFAEGLAGGTEGTI
jgi:uncharacterized membrane protein